MYKWEYKVVDTSPWGSSTWSVVAQFNEHLNKLGEDGWELVLETERTHGYKYFIFKKIVATNVSNILTKEK